MGSEPIDFGADIGDGCFKVVISAPVSVCRAFVCLGDLGDSNAAGNRWFLILRIRFCFTIEPELLTKNELSTYTPACVKGLNPSKSLSASFCVSRISPFTFCITSDTWVAMDETMFGRFWL